MILSIKYRRIVLCKVCTGSTLSEVLKESKEEKAQGVHMIFSQVSSFKERSAQHAPRFESLRVTKLSINSE
jgi:hypothetical protein